jgi:hypothetical protein
VVKTQDKSMYVLIGTRNDVYQDKIGEPFEDHYTEEQVALFTSEKEAKEYIEKARLKHPKRQSFGDTITFKRNSLLMGYEYAHVEEYDEPDLPINPKI